MDGIKTVETLTSTWRAAPFAPPSATAALFTDASTRGFGGWGTVRELVGEGEQCMAGTIRTQLTMGRLSTSRGNQYATALRSFCKFCATFDQLITLD